MTQLLENAIIYGNYCSFVDKGSATYKTLHAKWSQKHTVSKQNLWSMHAHALREILNGIPHKKLMASSLSALMLLHVPSSVLSSLPSMQNDPVAVHAEAKPLKDNSITVVPPVHSPSSLVHDLSPSLPVPAAPLNATQENTITSTLSSYFDFNVKAELNGIRLNQNYGYIGQEQLLPLFPGDTVDSHFQSNSDLLQYGHYGITPGRGAWGYFADSKADLTEEDIAREKYYIAVPTFLSPGYNEHVQEYYNFYRYRKMLVVNPDNGKAIVADIGDSGPAPFTGKQLGGSPAVMQYLGRVDGAQRGTVLYFFIDDPNSTIPLGPITIPQNL